MREFVEQVGSNVITKDKIIGIDGAINVKEHLYCNRL
jgi:hypothetical protein